MNGIHDTLFRLIDVLDAEQVPYALMGGMAVQVLAVPTPTYDIDLTVDLSEDEMPGVIAVLGDAGFTVPEAYSQGLLDSVHGMPKIHILAFGAQGQSVEVDIFLASTQLQRTAFARRQQGPLHGRSVWVFSPEDLILLKLIAWRYKDRAAIQNILITCTDLDADHLRRWAAELEVSDRLEQALGDAERFWDT